MSQGLLNICEEVAGRGCEVGRRRAIVRRRGWRSR
jgi:hypothetical protein